MTLLLVLLLAHESSVSSSRLEVDGQEIRATFTFSLEDLAGLARLDLNRDGKVDPDEWTRVLPGIFSYVGKKFRIEGCRSEGDLRRLPPPLSMGDGRAPVTVVMRYRSFQPLESLRIGCDLFAEHGGNPRHVAELAGGRTIVFDRERRLVDVAVSGRALPGFPYHRVLVVVRLALLAALLARAKSGHCRSAAISVGVP